MNTITDNVKVNIADNSLDKARKLKRESEHRVSGSDFKNVLDKAKLSPGKEPVKDKKLWDTCVEMESLFVNKMFKEMRKTIHKSDWNHGGHAEEIFEDMLYDEYSLQVSKNSNLGLAKMIYEQMSSKF